VREKKYKYEHHKFIESKKSLFILISYSSSGGGIEEDEKLLQVTPLNPLENIN